MRRDIRVEQASLLDVGCDLIVNASNAAAALGSGVSRAIFEECGGLVLQRETRERLAEEFDGELAPGDCLVTSGGTSPRVRHVLHVASVDYGVTKVAPDERVTLATIGALGRAAAIGTTLAPSRVAFPLLGAGHGGLGTAASLKAIVDGMRSFFRDDPDAAISVIVLAVPEAAAFALARSRLEQLLVLH